MKKKWRYNEYYLRFYRLDDKGLSFLRAREQNRFLFFRTEQLQRESGTLLV